MEVHARAFRARSGLTQVVLARYSDCALETLRKLERGDVEGMRVLGGLDIWRDCGRSGDPGRPQTGHPAKLLVGGDRLDGGEYQCDSR
jgi:hypothetical protein